MINLAHRVWVVDADELRRHTEGQPLDGKILRRIVDVELIPNAWHTTRRIMLNCGHHVDVPRGLRPTVGKLTGCPECK